jgi:hypothetical protein
VADPIPEHPLCVGHVAAERAGVPVGHVAKHAWNLSGNVPPTLTLPLKGGGDFIESGNVSPTLTLPRTPRTAAAVRGHGREDFSARFHAQAH